MMDKLGLSMQILSICNVNMEVLSDEDAIRYSQMSNDILAEGIHKNTDRFRGFAAIPTGVPEEAIKELERCAAIGGFVGAVINGHINGHYLDGPQFDPILAAVERLNMVLYIHPAIPPKSVIDTYYKMEDKYAQNVLTTGGWGWHIETGVHVLRLIASGAFDRHPNLKVIVGHLGEGLPFFMERLYNAKGGNLKKPYPEYLKENVYYTISGFHDPDLFQYVLKKVGENHIMFSTDFPFTDPVQEVAFMNTFSGTNVIREKIAYQNAEKLFEFAR
ncbi:MAG: amidohydrolase family protein [Faecousia sp.]